MVQQDLQDRIKELEQNLLESERKNIELEAKTKR